MPPEEVVRQIDTSPFGLRTYSEGSPRSMVGITDMGREGVKEEQDEEKQR